MGMERRLFFWEFVGVLFVAVTGSLLHFVYEWSGENLLAAVISAVNESTWEHMKLLFVPLVVFSAIQVYVLRKRYPNFLAVRAVSTLTGLALIPILFYTYTGILGYHLSWVNILIFYLADLALFWVDFRLLKNGRFPAVWQQVLGFVVLWVLIFCFVWCTFRPPHLNLWRDPTNGTFGI